MYARNDHPIPSAAIFSATARINSVQSEGTCGLRTIRLPALRCVPPLPVAGYWARDLIDDTNRPVSPPAGARPRGHLLSVFVLAGRGRLRGRLLRVAHRR